MAMFGGQRTPAFSQPDTRPSPPRRRIPRSRIHPPWSLDPQRSRTCSRSRITLGAACAPSARDSVPGRRQAAGPALPHLAGRHVAWTRRPSHLTYAFGDQPGDSRPQCRSATRKGEVSEGLVFVRHARAGWHRPPTIPSGEHRRPAAVEDKVAPGERTTLVRSPGIWWTTSDFGRLSNTTEWAGGGDVFMGRVSTKQVA